MDASVANQVGDIFDSMGVSYFRDVKNLKWGDRIDTEVQVALEDCGAILVILSPASLKSLWVPYEIGYFSALKRRVLPLLTHPSLELPAYISSLKHISAISELPDALAVAHSQLASQASSSDSPLPDIRIRYTPAVTRNHQGDLSTVVAFNIENHDSQTVFMNNLAFHLNDGRKVQILRDGITGAYFGRRSLQPGQRMDVHVTSEIFENDDVHPSSVVAVVATDDIGRRYSGDPNGLQSCLFELLPKRFPK